MNLSLPKLAIRLSTIGLALAAATTAGCLEGPDAARGTTRMCPDDAGADPMCFQQCADAEVLDCAVLDPEGGAVEECAHDGATGAYLFVDGAYVPPPGAELCFALRADADASTPDPNDDLAADCDEDDKSLQVVVQGAADETCYDVNCAVTTGC